VIGGDRVRPPVAGTGRPAGTATAHTPGCRRTRQNLCAGITRCVRCGAEAAARAPHPVLGGNACRLPEPMIMSAVRTGSHGPCTPIHRRRDRGASGRESPTLHATAAASTDTGADRQPDRRPRHAVCPGGPPCRSTTGCAESTGGERTTTSRTSRGARVRDRAITGASRHADIVSAAPSTCPRSTRDCREGRAGSADQRSVDSVDPPEAGIGDLEDRPGATRRGPPGAARAPRGRTSRAPVSRETRAQSVVGFRFISAAMRSRSSTDPNSTTIRPLR
jgi:hypothetical protein